MELPHALSHIDDDSCQLPWVDPIEPIVTSWDKLPIDPDLKNVSNSHLCTYFHALGDLVKGSATLLSEITHYT